MQKRQEESTRVTSRGSNDQTATTTKSNTVNVGNRGSQRPQTMPSYKPISVIGNGAFGKIWNCAFSVDLILYYRLCFHGRRQKQQQQEGGTETNPEGWQHCLARVWGPQASRGCPKCCSACGFLLLCWREAEDHLKHSDGVLWWQSGGCSTKGRV